MFRQPTKGVTLKTKKLRKAYKAQVKISEETSQTLWTMSRVLVQLWNMGVLQAEQWLGSKERFITAYSFNYWLTGMRQFYIVLKNGEKIKLSSISSDCEREVLRKLAGSYQSYFNLKKNKDARARLPWTRQEDWFLTLSWSSFSIEGGKLYLPGMDRQTLTIEIGEYLQGRIRDKEVVHVTLACHNGVFELSLVTASPLPEVPETPKFFRAIDLGAGDIAVTDSDGSEFIIPARRPDKFWRQKVQHIEARAERRKKNSRGWKRLMKARRDIWNKSRAQHISHQRKLAYALVEEKVECIIIGKAKTRLGLSQSDPGTSDEHWGVQNTGYMFRLPLFIKEKAQERGVKIIEVPDPPRKTGDENPESKFAATRAMLGQVLGQNQTEVSFVRRKFRFVQ